MQVSILTFKNLIGHITSIYPKNSKAIKKRLHRREGLLNEDLNDFKEIFCYSPDTLCKSHIFMKSGLTVYDRESTTIYSNLQEGLSGCTDNYLSGIIMERKTEIIYYADTITYLLGG